jgi:hypothetical protein
MEAEVETGWPVPGRAYNRSVRPPRFRGCEGENIGRISAVARTGLRVLDL